MTREEAIKWLDWAKLDMRQRGYDDIVAAISMAIHALEKEAREENEQNYRKEEEEWYNGIRGYMGD